jgi:hypothetical protein
VPTRKVEKRLSFCMPRIYTDFSVSMFVGDFSDHFCALTLRPGPEFTRIFLPPCLSVISVTISALSRPTHAQKTWPRTGPETQPEKYRLRTHRRPFLSSRGGGVQEDATRRVDAELSIVLRVLQWPFDGLLQPLLDVFEATEDIPW